MRTKLALLAFALLGLTLAACIPTSQHPLSDPATSTPDNQLSGLWLRGDQTEQQYLHIGRAHQPLDPARSEVEPGLMRFWMITHHLSEGRLSEPFSMHFFSTQLGDRLFANLAVPPEGSTPGIPAKPQGYMIVTYQVDGDQLTVRLMDLDVAASLVESGKLAGNVEREPEKNRVTKVTITSPTPQLAELLSVTDLDRLFPTDRKSVYNRVR